MCSCQPLNRNPKGAPTIQQLTIQDRRKDKAGKNTVRPSYTPVSGPDGPLTRRYAPAAGKPLPEPLRSRTVTFSSLTDRMASQGGKGAGDIRVIVPACAGLRRFSSVPYVTKECRLPCR
ncbi:hypothetical protein D6F77_25845 [Salmonella enterica]|nr:hypothetical protein [Salmonella enterica]EAP2593710.1 hypothetical protein [Salmonella enterica]